VLSESSKPLGSITIARELERHGIFLSERAIRYHLRITDQRGYTKSFARDARMLTPQGLEELQWGFILLENLYRTLMITGNAKGDSRKITRKIYPVKMAEVFLFACRDKERWQPNIILSKNKQPQECG